MSDDLFKGFLELSRRCDSMNMGESAWFLWREALAYAPTTSERISLLKEYCPISIPIDANPEIGEKIASTAIDLIRAGYRSKGIEVVGLASQLSASKKPLERTVRTILEVPEMTEPNRKGVIVKRFATRLRACSTELAELGSARAWQLQHFANEFSPEKVSSSSLKNCRAALPFAVPTKFLADLNALKKRALFSDDRHAWHLFASLAYFEKVVTGPRIANLPTEPCERAIPIFPQRSLGDDFDDEVELTLHKRGWQAEHARLCKTHFVSESDPKTFKTILDGLVGKPNSELPIYGKALMHLTSCPDPDPSPGPNPIQIEPERRYPVGHFYYCEADELQELAAHLTIAPPPAGKELEFHFWLDPSIQGISFAGPRPSVSPPGDLVYPMTLQVDAFSGDGFRIQNPIAELVLNATGPTEHVRFRLALAKESGPASLFVFIRHKGTLIAVFKISAELASALGPASMPQLMEIGYLTSDWFRVEGHPPKTHLTLYFCRDRGGLSLFTLAPDEPPFRNLRVTAPELYAKTTGFYVKLHEIALKYSRAAETSTHFDRLGAGDALAKYGFNLFAAIFPGSPDPQLKRLQGLVRGLPVGSVVTIAIAPEARDIVVPWNLIYDADPPRESGTHAMVEHFWGARFRLNVRFATGLDSGKASGGKLKAARLWQKHEQTRLLARALKPFDKQIRWERLRVQSGRIPKLESSDARLIHFFCHGNSSIDGLGEARQKLDIQFKAHVASIPGPHTTKGYLQKLESMSDGPSTSLLFADNATAELDLMRTTGISLPASPIVILSMCESAQATCSGLGFVPFFLEAGAQAAIGTEASSPWEISAAIDGEVIRRLLEGEGVGDALFAARTAQLGKGNILALIYSLYGDANAKL